ncbi:MAG: DRTGG domain-containing protein [Synergistaceae bacterium]|nr:DRTGG domain-containing protein [Synergistaceae bacterium]
MKLREVAEILDAEVLCGGENIDSIEVTNGYAADLMSDVLAFATPSVLLLTGLTNVQIFRTAQMLDIPAIVSVRGKMPQDELLALAKEADMPVLLTKNSMFAACGKLYEKGMLPCTIPNRQGE